MNIHIPFDKHNEQAKQVIPSNTNELVNAGMNMYVGMKVLEGISDKLDWDKQLLVWLPCSKCKDSPCNMDINNKPLCEKCRS